MSGRGPSRSARTPVARSAVIGAKTSATSRASTSRSRIATQTAHRKSRPKRTWTRGSADRTSARCRQRGRQALLPESGTGRRRGGIGDAARRHRADRAESPALGRRRGTAVDRVRPPFRCPRRSADSRSSSRSTRSRQRAPDGRRRDRSRAPARCRASRSPDEAPGCGESWQSRHRRHRPRSGRPAPMLDTASRMAP